MAREIEDMEGNLREVVGISGREFGVRKKMESCERSSSSSHF